ncbi:MAG: hypothetical protein J6S11_04835 [Bacteroidaceae bacterium]|nr:hypothetical protein [Bacteroidaceae bacterium]
MINYVNNSFDKVLKPCDAQQFMTLTQSEQTEKLILGHRAGEKNSKAKLPALTYMGVLDEAKYKDYLKKCEAQGTKPLGSRRAEFMRPTGLLMLDFDHVGNVRALYDHVLNAFQKHGVHTEPYLALAHITPSGDGLRLVLKRTVGLTIEQDQQDWCKFIDGVTPDAACKDISRLSFAPMQSEVLYYNPSLLFAELPEAADYPDGSIFQQSFAVASPAEVAAPIAQGEAPAEYDTEYRGVPYSEIVKRLEEQLGGRPEHGARNSFIFSMACNLRYVCNDDAAWIASILPTYGEDAQKHRTTIQSAVNRPMSREMPETLKRALGVAKMCGEGDSQLSTLNPQLSSPPALPEVLPQPVSLLVERIPERMRAAAAMAVFPALGAYVKDMHLVYADGRDYEPTFMNILVAEQSAGKSAVNKPIDHILASLKARDEVSLNREREWKEKCAIISSTQDKPERPKGLCVQILPPDMTNAAFVQRLSDADGHFLYTRMDEVELLNALRTNGTANMVSAVLRLAFDCGEYGQVRVAANAVNAMVRVRWNWNASSTVQRVRKYFAKNIADGTLSRLSFATIPESEEDVYSEEFPVYEQYAENYAERLQPYIDRIETCTGTLHCPEAVAWVRAINKELLTFAREAEDGGYARMSRRGILMGFFRAMLLYVMNGCQWDERIERFASWSVKYDLWCKMRFFRDMLRNDIEGERAALQRGPVGLLPLLPQEFTRDDVRALRIAQGMKPDPNNAIKQWLHRGQVEKDDARGLYVKKVTVTGYS